jgi:hypothetical protein
MVESCLEENTNSYKNHTHDTHYEYDHDEEKHLTSIGGSANGDQSNLSKRQASKIAAHLNSHGIKASHTSTKDKTWGGIRTGHVVNIYHHDPEKVAKVLNTSKEHKEWAGGDIHPHELNGRFDSHSKYNYVRPRSRFDN